MSTYKLDIYLIRGLFTCYINNCISSKTVLTQWPVRVGQTK